MGDFPRKSFGGAPRGGGFRPRGGRPSFGGRGGFGGGREERQLFDAKCANCGRDCQVPFEPNGKKPVFCKDCFVRPEEGQGPRDFDRRDDRRDDRHEAPFKPAAPRAAAPDPRIDALKKDIDALNQKVETVIELLRAQALHATIEKVTKKKTTKK